MKNKTLIFIIHGGMTFKNRKDYLKYLKNRKVSIEKRASWSGDYLDKKLGRNFEIIRPIMPLKEDAKYEEWKISFERYAPFFKGKVILIGNSLGGVFLAKYLSETKLSKKLLSVYLVCPPFDDTLEGEDLVGGFKLGPDLSLLEKNAKNVRLCFSSDDETVPVSHAEKYRKKLPNADIRVFKNKNGHFKVSEFPEIVGMIKMDAREK